MKKYLLGLLFLVSAVVLGSSATKTSFDAATQLTGNLPISVFNSGTNADSTTFWRGDGIWATPAGSGGGTVNSVSLAVPASSIFGQSGSPITNSGTLTLSTTGTSGGVPYFDTTTTLNTSAMLTNHAIVLGGGAGAPPVSLGSLGTTTTLLHGNTSGNPTFAAVSLVSDITGTLPILNGGTGQTMKANAFDALSPLTTGGDLLYGGASGIGTRLANGTAGQVLTSAGTTLAPTWTTPTTGTVTAVSVASANGLAGSSSGGATPALTLSTSVSGLVKANGTAFSAATSGTDYSAGTSGLATGILKSTTSTGGLTIAVAGDFPTLNQNTSGSAASLSATLGPTTGGTGLTTYTSGDTLYASASNVLSKLAKGSDGQVLTLASGLPSWATPTTGTVTSVAFSVPATSIFAATGSPVTSSGTLGLTTTGTSGGVPYFSSTSALSTSALLAANQLMLGGGAATAPATLGSLGSTTTLLHGNASGAPSFGAVALASDVSGTLPLLNGGTGTAAASANAAFNALSPLTTKGDVLGFSTVNARLGVGTDGQVLQADAASTLGFKWATVSGTGTVTSVALSVPASSIFGTTGSPVTSSGTLGLTTTGTSGGIPYFSSSAVISSSAVLTANQIVLGGGAGAQPVPLGSLGTTTTVLHGNAGGAPTYGAIVNADITNSTIDLTTKVTGVLPTANGGRPTTLGQQISSASGSYTFTGGSGVSDVTNLTVTITTTGRPVFVGIIPGSSSTSYLACQINTSANQCTAVFYIVRSLSGTPTTLSGSYVGTGPVTTNQAAMYIRVPPSSVFIIDPVSSGTYTYKIQVDTLASSANAKAEDVKLVAYEL